MNTSVKKTEKISSIILFTFLISQFIMIVFYNLSDIRNSLDTDSANALYHVCQMIQLKRLTIPDWTYSTTLEIDSSVIFAIIPYIISNNIFLSAGIANIIYTVILLLVVYQIGKLFFIRKNMILVLLNIIVIPYSFGMLEYFNMIFFEAAQYSIKLLTPLLMIAVISSIRILQDKILHKWYFKAEIIFTLCMIFLNSFSSGIYVFICGILPIVIVLISELCLDTNIHKNKYFIYTLIFSGIFIIITGIGLFLHTSLQQSAFRNGMQLTTLNNWLSNFNSIVTGIFQIFGALATTTVSAMSTDGIYILLKQGFVLIALFIVLRETKLLFHKSEKFDMHKYFLAVILFNLLILVLCDTRYSKKNINMEYRYLIIFLIPMMIITCKYVDEFLIHHNIFSNILIYTAIISWILFVGLKSDINILHNWDRSSQALDICNYVSQLDSDSIILINDVEVAEKCKVIDQSKKYISYDSQNQCFTQSIDNYASAFSADYYSEKNVVLIFSGTALTDYISAEKASGYTLVGTVRYYDVYISNSNPFKSSS